MGYRYQSGSARVISVTNSGDGNKIVELPKAEPGLLFILSSVESGEVSLTSDLNPTLETDINTQSFGELVSDSNLGTISLFSLGNNKWTLLSRNRFDYAVKYRFTGGEWESSYVTSGTPIVPRLF